MTLTTVAVNGVPLESYGLQPIELEGWLAPPMPKYATSALVGRVGSVPSTRGMTWEPRVLSLGVRAVAGSIAASRSALNDWYRVTRGLLEVEVIDGTGKVCYGLFEGATQNTPGVKLLHPDLEVIGQIVCHDPVWYDRSPTMASGAATERVALPVGSIDGRWRLLVVGAATNPTLTLRDRTGTAISSMRFTTTLAADDALLVASDLGTGGIVRYTAGGASDAFATLNVDDFLLSIDPLDDPTVETSVGSLIVTSWRGYMT